jgi:hypothetical protein
MHGFQWSFSSLKQFINCPKQYHEVKVLRNFVVQETEQMRYGTEVHKACEDYVRDGTPLAKNYQRFKPLLDALLQSPGQRYPEIKMALKKDKTACEFDDPDRWVRGIADLLVVDGDTAWVSDYKSGSAKYPDTKQLKLMALMVFARFPEVQVVKAALLFLSHDVFIDEQYRREDIDKLWATFHPDLMRLQVAFDNGVWPTNPTGLCGWCPVTSCKFHRSR